MASTAHFDVDAWAWYKYLSCILFKVVGNYRTELLQDSLEPHLCCPTRVALAALVPVHIPNGDPIRYIQ